jgi:hydrogenase maturation protein HypF
MNSKRIFVTGIVQGVGFRPFVYGLATRLSLRGWVNNTSAGVEILVQGAEETISTFIEALSAEKPLLAHIEQIRAEDDSSDLFERFEIRESESIAGAFQPISPDIAICPDCERELFDPHDRRYLYPFINCTNCGPRFTIIKDLPYDRPFTTMADFAMCDDCRAEYVDPFDRRFHAQPVACPDCGPYVWLVRNDRTSLTVNRAAILEARRLLHEGKIVAVKGLGGFHLACDAGSPAAVDELRRRKGRAGKPFALMAANITKAEQLVKIDDGARVLLTGREKPIVLLPRREYAPVVDSVAPGMDSLGVMLPYTPLHHLLLNQNDPVLAAEPVPLVLVMTSGNFNEEPIATDNLDALERLAPLADAFLLHNRAIQTRADDSVVKVNGGQLTVDGNKPAANRQPPTVYLRRSRGYAPYPVYLPFDSVPTLAVGGELKNTFCLTRDRYVFLSQHIGDMENAEVYESFERGVEHLSRLFRVQPEIIAHDMHPNYFTTRWALRDSWPQARRVAVQHHHAHIAACMADNRMPNQKVIGLSFDGTGYGTDGHIWGGEFLVADYCGFERAAHLEYLPLPGGEAAIHKPWRTAVGYAAALDLKIDDMRFVRSLESRAVDVVRKQVAKHLNAPQTSSMGRLFDAVASLAGVRNEVTYEAQAAMELEVLSKSHLGAAHPYLFEIQESADSLVVGLRALLEQVVHDLMNYEAPGMIGAKFHHTVAAMAVEVSKRIREQTGINEVVLSGGVWQNQVLFDLTRSLLRKEEFEIYVHKQTPANDGGLSLGQAVIASFGR